MSLNLFVKERAIDRHSTFLLKRAIGIDMQHPNALTDQWAYSKGYCKGCATDDILIIVTPTNPLLKLPRDLSNNIPTCRPELKLC